MCAMLQQQGSQRSGIPARDHVLLSTWEKWVMYGRFPTKLALHLSLVLLTTWQCVRFNQNDAAYVRATHRNFQYYFFPEDFDFRQPNYYLYTVNDVVDSVARVVSQFDAIVDTSVDKMSHPAPGRGCDEEDGDAWRCTVGELAVVRYTAAPRLLFQHKESIHDLDGKRIHEAFLINASDLGPFDLRRYTYQEVSDYTQSLYHFELRYRLVASGPKDTGRNCLVWEVTMRYKFQQRGQINLFLSSAIVDDCIDEMDISQQLSHLVHQLNMSVLILSAWSLLLSLRSVWTSFSLLRKLGQLRRRRRRLQLMDPAPAMLSRSTSSNDSNIEVSEPLLGMPDLGEFNNVIDGDSLHVALHDSLRAGASATDMLSESVRNFDESDSELSCSDKLRFFSVWIVIFAISGVLNIVSSSRSLAYNRMYSPSGCADKVIMGLGCGFLWISLINHLAHKPSYYTIALTLTRAVPRAARFLAGVMPILLAYAIFGMLYFGDHSERFGDFALSMITLFSVLNGDVVRETFMDLITFYPVVSQIYLYTFVCLFLYVVLNVFIAIVEESFFATRAKARSLELFAKQVARQEDEEHQRARNGDGNENMNNNNGNEGDENYEPCDLASMLASETRESIGANIEGTSIEARGVTGARQRGAAQLRASTKSAHLRSQRQKHNDKSFDSTESCMQPNRYEATASPFLGPISADSPYITRSSVDGSLTEEQRNLIRFREALQDLDDPGDG